MMIKMAQNKIHIPYLWLVTFLPSVLAMTSFNTTQAFALNCPTNCSCDQPTVSFLNITCEGNSSSEFEDELNEILMDSPQRNITHFCINYTPLTKLSGVNMTILKNLHILDLRHNYINGIPERYFANNHDLVVLYLSNNSISELAPDSFEGLAILQTFDMANNSVVTLPRGIFSYMKKVKSILLSRNAITTLDDDLLQGMTELNRIDLSNNSITSIGTQTFLDLPSIEKILLSFNPLRELDVWPIHVTVNIPHYTQINVDNTLVSKFTNNLNWTYDCSMPAANGKFRVEMGNIHHFMDIINGYTSGWEQISIVCLWRTDSFRLDFLWNPYICDCVDYNVYKFLFRTTKAHRIDQLQCNEPAKWKKTKIISHHLSEFVCDLSSNCPTGCTCLQRPDNMTLHMLCQDGELPALPLTIPHCHNLSGYQYSLQFQGNAISILNDQWYFKRTYGADFSHNYIENVDVEAVMSFTDRENPAQYLYLHGNQLNILPRKIQSVNITKLEHFSLHNNPWACTCDNKWMKSWIHAIQLQLVFPNGIMCDTPRWLHGQSIIEADFCSNPKQELIKQIIEAIFSTLGAILLLFVLPSSVIYLRRRWIYAHFRWHPFDWDECEGEDKEFDAFISYATEDEQWVLQLINNLEKEHGFRVTFHRRHFNGGKPVVVNVEDAIERSKRTVCIISQSFIHSQVCKWEFDTALTLIIQGLKSRMIVIKYEELIKNEVPRSIASYMQRYTYVNRQSAHFWENLLYSLPVRRLGQRTIESEGEVENGEGSTNNDSNGRTPLLT